MGVGGHSLYKHGQGCADEMGHFQSLSGTGVFHCKTNLGRKYILVWKGVNVNACLERGGN